MKHIEIVFKSNGYVVTLRDFPRDNGEFVYKATEEFRLLEDIGFAIHGKKIEVREK